MTHTTDQPPTPSPGNPHTAPTAQLPPDEAARPQHAVRRCARIDRAVGVLMAIGRLGSGEARHVLHETAAHTGIPLRDLSDLVLDGARAGRVDERVAHVLREQLDMAPRLVAHRAARVGNAMS
ncbi:ANTAR domain-containing protein [Streptomyces fuscigenes]|uniref:ANTAR domain-containing protein n=1 Tax=Streptomyces fuscigenes TaxID=1528880 RepID=UPI001F3BB4DB|nr:ANTAR domain-containing protein [Streptomyces fuscigenes]MCF3960916.1 ANTAR domain-containing protein [Streptomyces fuscigenes]